ncbi:MAG: hypothetical protein Q9162_004374 [Coniocarpon cinnabarinum]
MDSLEDVKNNLPPEDAAEDRSSITSTSDNEGYARTDLIPDLFPNVVNAYVDLAYDHHLEVIKPTDATHWRLVKTAIYDRLILGHDLIQYHATLGSQVTYAIKSFPPLSREGFTIEKFYQARVPAMPKEIPIPMVQDSRPYYGLRLMRIAVTCREFFHLALKRSREHLTNLRAYETGMLQGGENERDAKNLLVSDFVKVLQRREERSMLNMLARDIWCRVQDLEFLWNIRELLWFTQLFSRETEADADVTRGHDWLTQAGDGAEAHYPPHIVQEVLAGRCV